MTEPFAALLGDRGGMDSEGGGDEIIGTDDETNTDRALIGTVRGVGVNETDLVVHLGLEPQGTLLNWKGRREVSDSIYRAKRSSRRAPEIISPISGASAKAVSR